MIFLFALPEVFTTRYHIEIKDNVVYPSGKVLLHIELNDGKLSRMFGDEDIIAFDEEGLKVYTTYVESPEEE